MQPSLPHKEKYHSSDARPLLLSRERDSGGKKRKTAGGWRLIFKSFRWSPAPALHTEGKRIPQRSWPADPVASKQPSIPQQPTRPPHLAIQPCLLHKSLATHPNTSPSCLIHPPWREDHKLVSVCQLLLCILGLMRVPTNTGEKNHKKWLIMERCDSLWYQFITTAPVQDVAAFFISGGLMMWCFVSVGAFFLQMREETEPLAWRNASHDADTRLFRLPKINRNTFFFYLRQHLAKMCESAPLGFPSCEPSLSVHVSSYEAPGRGGRSVFMSEMKGGVTRRR